MAIFVGGAADGQDIAVESGVNRIKIPYFTVTTLWVDKHDEYPRTSTWREDVYERGEDGRFYFVGPAVQPVIVEGK